ncbi:MAG: YifB family Mg chelatase-like AAA ATPase [Bacteroidales bacterium]|nr:YifB family Mg chelatase-like AAA ATPase [Bacteroidales bacterium]
MLTHIHGAKCIGIDAVEVTVEIDIDRGIGIHLVGLADVAVKESLLRTTTALEALGFRIPGKKIVINLAPADLRKNGSGYDLPIAVGIIAASEQRHLPRAEQFILMGELGLDGSVRPIPGALPFAEMARQTGFEGIILPVESALEAAEFKEMQVYGVEGLGDVVRILEGVEDCQDMLIWNTQRYRKVHRARLAEPRYEPGVDFADIIGQEGAKRGVEIAAAGGHNIIMVGAPGSGKSSLAKALAGILPPMTKEEALVTSKIYSVAGKGSPQDGLIRRRPFRAPHYSASMAALVGGGGGDNILPGEVSLAHGGVLFIDELGQMPKSVIEALRGPIEDRSVCISRLKAKMEFPSSFMLVAASNPCPCGYYGEGDRCTCTPSQRQSYLSKLSGPIMDRIDLHVWMHPVPADRIMNAQKAESSEAVAARVLKARIAQKHRFAPDATATNAEMNLKQIERFCPLSESCRTALEGLMTKMGFSMRAYYRIIKVARTIADLEGASDIRPAHLLEAASYRFLDRRNLYEMIK